jgi:hypothetical protein
MKFLTKVNERPKDQQTLTQRSTWNSHRALSKQAIVAISSVIRESIHSRINILFILKTTVAKEKFFSHHDDFER